MPGFRKATREQAKLRLALIGPAGSGKTYSALAIGSEIARLIRESGRGPGRLGVLDTECGSAELYAKTFEFETMDLTDHSPMTYVSSIEMAEREGFDVLIVDSLSHAWMGKNGALEQVDKAVERGAGNSFSAWRSITPKHNALVDKMLSCKLHLIATVRAKTEYVQEKDDKGKTTIKKIGMAAIQREGLDFEFTLVGDLDQTNTMRISKTRLDGVIVPGEMFEKPGASLAKKIYMWLVDGAAPKSREPVAIVAPSTAVADAVDAAFDTFLKAIENAPDQTALDAAVSGPGKPMKGTPQHQRAGDAFRARQAWIRAQAAA